MKTAILIQAFLWALFYRAQGQAFQDLSFEQATLTTSEAGGNVNAASALPGWSVYFGTLQQSKVLQNQYTLNEVSVDIFGPNYAAASGTQQTFFGFSPGTIDGQYSVMLQAGANENEPPPAQENASIAQTGLVPGTAQTLEFEAYLGTPSTAFSVSLNGNVLTPVVLGSGANYTLYGVDVAPYAGTDSALEFSALFTDGRTSEFGLDDISFSSNALPSAVPEPSPFILLGIGGLILIGRMYRPLSFKHQ